MRRVKDYEVIKMKKFFAAVAVLCFCFCGIGMAETMDVFNGFELAEGEAVSIDLNNDGAMEIVCWNSVEDAEAYCSYAEVTVMSEDNTVATWSEELYGVNVYVSDFDDNGTYEIFVCGDVASDDYFTFCFSYSGSGLLPILFPDINRGENTEAYYECGYGCVVSIVDGALTLSGSQDVLGTRFGSRVVGLQDGRFEIVDDGMWRFEYYEDPEIWEYAALNPIVDIPAMFMEDGDEYEGVIRAGEKLLVTASDKYSVVYFRLQDGRQGYFYAAPNVVHSEWGDYTDGYNVNGMHEQEVFEYIPYAD